MPKVIVVGGGVAGCAAALAARKAGAAVVLYERTDMLFGVAVRAGEVNGNGWFIGQKELGFLGGGEFFAALESLKLHDNTPFPDATKGHPFIFHTGKAEPLFRKILLDAGVELHLETRVMDARKSGARVRSVKAAGSWVEGDAFVDATGSRGGISVCTRYGKGCLMCLVRCPAFGDRMGIVERLGGKALTRTRPDGTPGMLNSAISLYKDSLAPDLLARLEKEGLLKIPIPAGLVDYAKVGLGDAARPKEFVENIILGDIGPVAKCFGMVYMPQEQLRKVPGFENVQVEDPRSSRFNHICNVTFAERDVALRATGFENLFCAGETAGNGAVVGSMATGYIAGHNAARSAFGKEPLVLPKSLALGDWIAFVGEQYATEEGRKKHFGMGRGFYWERMLKLGLYTDNVDEIKKRVEAAGLAGVLAKKIV